MAAPLTPAEAARYRRIRQEAQQELPPAKPDPVNVAIAKLRAVREAQGVTLAELAERSGMTRSRRGPPRIAKNATLQTLDRYARALGCKLEIDVVAVNVTKRKAAHALR